MKKFDMILLLTIVIFALFIACKKDDNITNSSNNIFTFTTSKITDITQTTAVSGGSIVQHGGSPVTARGVCWSTSNDPTISDRKTIDGAGVGNFTSEISGLEPNTTYYIRAYVITNDSLSYGNELMFTTYNYPPKADFMATPTNGTRPLTINFTDMSTNDPIEWQWNFGDGSTSTQQNPEHTYQLSGIYSVQLIVTNSFESDSETKANYISVNSGGGIGEPCTGTTTVIDFDGNVYNTVQIGDQCWMKENLKTTRDAEGNSIIRYCYSNNLTNCELYGGLYTWITAMNGAGSSNSNPSGIQGICPAGWHIPSDAEWTQLSGYMATQGFLNINVISGAGNALKSCRQSKSPLGGDCSTNVHPRWEFHSTHYGFDEFGFSALPGGARGISGSFSFYGLGNFGHWLSSTEAAYSIPWIRNLNYSNGYVQRDSQFSKHYGLSLRCLRD